MAFNFGGMMRGLGAGLTQTGAWMKEQEKLDWETQQATLKYEREQHMEKLRMQNQKEMQKEGFTHDYDVLEKTQAHTESMTDKTIASHERTADRAYEAQMKSLSIQEQEAQAAAGARSAAAANDAIRLNMEKGVYEEKMRKLSPKQIEKDANTLKEAGFSEAAIATYKVSGVIPTAKDSDRIPVTVEDIRATKTEREIAWEKASGKDRATYKLNMKAPTKEAAKEMFLAEGVQDLMIQTGHVSLANQNSQGGTPQPQETRVKGELPTTQVDTYAKTLSTLSASDRTKAISDLEKSGVSKMSIFKITSRAKELETESGVRTPTAPGVRPIGSGDSTSIPGFGTSGILRSTH